MIIEHGQQVETLSDNKIIGELDAEDTTISFKGTGNILFLEPGVRLIGSDIKFCGNNALVYLSSDERHPYKLKIDAWRGTTVYFGRDNYFNNTFNAIISERKNLIVGNDGVFSFGIWVRTADPHLLYDIDTMDRINKSRSVFIGDHVWLGQDAIILKGSKIGSGSVISAGCVLANKGVKSNSVFAGNPAGMIKDNVFFTHENAHNFTAKQSKESMHYDGGREFVFESGEAVCFDDIDRSLSKEKDTEARLGILKKLVSDCKRKNRFYIGGPDE